MSKPRCAGRWFAAVAAILALGLGACGQPSLQAASPFKPTATFQDIMLALVDPAADRLWESVSTEISKAGIQEKQPRNDAEWLAVRHQAVTLIEAANLLLIDGRQLVAPGKTLDNKAGYLNPEDIRKSIDGTRPAYVARVHEFHDAAALALAAIDAKKPEALIDAGARIQQACEHCHLQYWYPNGGPPPVAALAGKTLGKGH